MIHLAVAYLAAFPVGWLLLRLVGVRPAWLIAFVGQLAWLPIVVLFSQPGGMHLTAAQYGLEGALAYALATMVVGLLTRLVRHP
jgi:hypothetical protein